MVYDQKYSLEPVLDALLAASPNRFSGIRQSVSWDPNPEVENRADQGTLGNPQFITGARVLAKKGFTLEGSQYFTQLREMAEFAKTVPDLKIVLNHIGGLMRVGPYGNRDDEVIPIWKDGIAAVGACPNIYIKLGGLGQPRYGFDWHTRNEPIGSEELAIDLAPYMNYCIEQFSPNRCMFESNFPPDKVSYSYNILFNAFKRLSSSYSTTERAALFHDTAVGFYKIPV